MTDGVNEPTVAEPSPPGKGRGRMAWLVVAMVALVVVGVGGLVLIDRGDEEPDPSATDTTATDAETTDGSEPGGGSDPSVTELSAPPAAGDARCAVPSPKILAKQQLAFDGTVTEIVEDRVTLEPAMFYAGEPTDLVQVTAPPEELRGLLASVEFQVGQRYLVAADRGVVSICGYSGRWSEGLERLYLKAFS